MSNPGKRPPPSRRQNVNTESVDNYLKAILAMGGLDGARVSSSDLAKRLGVAAASVTNMLQKLASGAVPFVDYQRHRGVRLTPSGNKRALEILRHHRLIESFLYEILEYPIEEIHEEAERLEHFISERFEERIAAKLGQPEFDPHGHCIPAMDGKMRFRASIPLEDTTGKGPFTVDSVSDEDNLALKKLGTKGVKPGSRFEVRARSRSGSMTLVLADSQTPFELSREAVRAIRLRAEPDHEGNPTRDSLNSVSS